MQTKQTCQIHGSLVRQRSDSTVVVAPLSRSQTVEVISYARQLQARGQFEETVNTELARFNLSDDLIGADVLSELALACGVSEYIEEARRVVAPTVMEQYEDILRVGGKITMDQYHVWYNQRVSSLFQQACGLDEKTFRSENGYTRHDPGSYNGTVYFSSVHETIIPLKRWWGLRVVERKKKTREQLGGMNFDSTKDRFGVTLFSESPQFTARVLPVMEPLHHDLGDLLVLGGYNPKKIFSFRFEARYLPK